MKKQRGQAYTPELVGRVQHEAEFVAQLLGRSVIVAEKDGKGIDVDPGEFKVTSTVVCINVADQTGPLKQPR